MRSYRIIYRAQHPQQSTAQFRKGPIVAGVNEQHARMKAIARGVRDIVRAEHMDIMSEASRTV